MTEPLEQPITDRPLIAHGRVWLRPMEERDLSGFMALVNDREVGRLAGFAMPFAPDGARAWLADKMKLASEAKGAFYTVCELGRGDFIGTVWLKDMDLARRSAELAIAMDAAHVGTGWGSEAQRAVLEHAFETMGLERIWLTVDVENARAIRSYQKVGFQLEGRLRSTIYRDGAWGDLLIMSMLRPEWLARRET